MQAISKVYLGNTTRSGVASSAAWHDFGFAISGLVFSDAQSGAAMHCKPQYLDPADASSVIVNAPDGVDNSFGKNLLPILLALDDAFPSEVQQSIDDGGVTSLVVVDSLGPEATYESLNVSVGPAVGMGGAPMNWQTHAWMPVNGEGHTLQGSYLTGNQLVAPPGGEIVIRLPYAGKVLKITVHHAVVVHTYGPDHTAATLGTISGILSVVELVKAISDLGLPSQCSDSQNHWDEFRAAADIGLDGKQDPTKTCDGISFAIGYDLMDTMKGNDIALMPPPDPCVGM